MRIPCETWFHQHHNGWGRVDGELAGLFQEIASAADGFCGIFPCTISEFFHVVTTLSICFN